MKIENRLHILIYCTLVSFYGIVFSSVVIVELMDKQILISLFGALLSILFGYLFFYSSIEAYKSNKILEEKE